MVSELTLAFENVLIGVVALAMAVLFWRLTRGSRAFDTILMRTALLLLLAPFVIAALFGAMPHRGEPGPTPPTREAASPPQPAPGGGRTGGAEVASKPAEPVPQTRPAPTMQARKQEATVPPPQAPASAPEPAPAPAPRSAEAPPVAKAAPPRPVAPPEAAKPSPVEDAVRELARKADENRPRAQPEEPRQAASASQSAGGEQTPASAPASPPASAPAAAPPPPPPAPVVQDEAKKEPWDVVPVYYGTDRAADKAGSRLAYTAERAGRLELGRALVTVPKTHEVPNVERPWVYRLPFSQIVLYQEKEDPARHFTVKELKAMSREELAQIVRDRLGASSDFKDQALVFLHGFNNSFDNALFRTAQIAYDLKFDGAPFMYSWPSRGQLGLQDYSYDRESSTQAEPYLRQFLEFVTKETGAKSVSIIAHSMGSQVLLNVLRELKRLPPEDVHISEVILAAPDVDRDTFAFLAKEIAGFGKGITVLASSNDRALEVSRRFWGGVPRAGDMAGGTPVLVNGIDTIDISALSTDVLSLNHSSYAERQQLLDNLRLLLKDGTRIDKYQPPLDRVTTDKGIYWRYPASP